MPHQDNTKYNDNNMKQIHFTKTLNKISRRQLPKVSDRKPCGSTPKVASQVSSQAAAYVVKMFSR
mgnify:CR=1 FL=1